MRRVAEGLSVTERTSTFNVTVVKRPLGGDRRAGLVQAVYDAPDGTDLVVLPYLGAYPHFWGVLDRAGYRYAERAPYPTVEAVRGAVYQRGVPVAVSFYEVVGEGVFYSTVALIGPDGEVRGTYRQAHALEVDGHHEQLFFQPGTTGQFPVFTVGPVRIGFLLGGDLWVPEAARLLALAGADVLIALNGYDPADGLTSEELAALAATRALENGCYLIYSSAGGDYWAFLVTCTGLIPASSRAEHRTFAAEVDLAHLKMYRRRFTPLGLRRPRLYGPLAVGEEGPLP